jgi:hypothetical protein
MTYAPRSARRLTAGLLSVGLAAVLASGTVLAGTPVTNGFRDHSYAGGAFRPSAEKGQSKLWYTSDGQWWAGMFRYTASPAVSENRIWKLTDDKTGWLLSGTIVDRRDAAHADYLWDEGSDTLYVASVSPIPDTTPTTTLTDQILIFKYSYSAGVYTPAAGFPKTVPNTGSVAGSSGGAATVTIAKDSTGDLWVVWPKNGQVRYSRSEDDAVTWSAPAQLPTQVGNSIKQSPVDADNDTAVVVAFGAGSANQVGIAWSDHDEAPTVGDNGYYFSAMAAGDDPTVEANWSKQLLPTTLTSGLGERADNHINIKATSDGSLYMVGKTGADTANCATNKQKSLIEVFERTPGGTWGAHQAGTVGDCNTRAQIVISEQLDTAYLFLTSPNGGGAIYRKSAPLNGADAFDFRGPADQTVQRGIPFIRSATETLIDDVSTTKQVVTSTTGIAAIANNVRSLAQTTGKFFFHNTMTLPSNDATAPSGTVSINGGAANTSSTTVSVAVPATDTGGSGMSLVRLSNASDMSNATTLVYTTPISWTIPAGDGNKTVYVEWRDAAGNWSATANDSINLNTTSETNPPTLPGIPKHRFLGSGRFGFPVRLDWTASTDASPPVTYQIQRKINTGAFADFATTTAAGYSLDLSHSTFTYQFRIRACDMFDNCSAYRTGPSFTTKSYSESNAATKYVGTWSLASSSVYAGGKARLTGTANRSVSLTFVGNQVAWLSRTGSSFGSARVYIDGTLVKTVSLFATTPVDRKLAYVKTWSTNGTHTIRVVVVGTAGHSRVTHDQFYVIR